ncbi:hypothetical protein AVEN_253051-1 [Araneus ventricosus]|uniref:Uncharacterized protein n=1 Tax=Araneus ventricosus TaxID=182803 RepID=A0A4Y2PQ45_ARAVE|nr:hypothetical protein AVEN_253051-1 [Araneus ventricosus]
MMRRHLKMAPPLQTSALHQQDNVWPPTYDLACNRSTCTTNLQWNRVSKRNPPAPKLRAYYWVTAVQIFGRIEYRTQDSHTLSFAAKLSRPVSQINFS